MIDYLVQALRHVNDAIDNVTVQRSAAIVRSPTPEQAETIARAIERTELNLYGAARDLATLIGLGAQDGTAIVTRRGEERREMERRAAEAREARLEAVRPVDETRREEVVRSEARPADESPF